MTHYYVSRTYIEAAQQLNEACCWLRDIGIDYSSTRLGRYQKILSHLAECQRTNTLEEFFETYSFANWVNAAYESAEIVRIHEGLHKSRDKSLTSRLRDSLRGHELYVLDTSDRSGRDFTFELSVASKFARYGFPIQFGSNADVETEVDGVRYYLECKRLKSRQKIRKRIKEGLKQLHRRYNSSSNPSTARGILALSIGKTVNSHLGLLEAKDDQSLGESGMKHCIAFIDEHRNVWQEKVDSRTLGALVVLDAPGVIQTENKLVTLHEVAMNNSVPKGSSDYRLFMHIAQNVFAKRAYPASPVKLIRGN